MKAKIGHSFWDAFLIGLGSILNLFGGYTGSNTPLGNDTQSIKEDWERIGGDIRRAWYECRLN